MTETRLLVTAAGAGMFGAIVFGIVLYIGFDICKYLEKNVFHIS